MNTTNIIEQDRKEAERLAVYLPLGRAVALALATAKAAGEGAKAEKGNAWQAFKNGIKAAKAAGHDAKGYRDGMSTACAAAGVPQGTLNGYITVSTQLADDYMADKLDTVTLDSISVKDARERYASEEEKAGKLARKQLADVIEKWTPEQVKALVAIASEATLKDAAPSQTRKDDVIAA